MLKLSTILGAVLFASVFCSLVVDACGAPIVLKEITAIGRGEQTLPFPGLPLESAPFDFRIYEPHIPAFSYAIWPEDYSPSDAGLSFFASPDIVAGANAARESTTAIYSLKTGGQFFSGGEDSRWHVGLSPDFHITALERVIDKLTLTRIDASRYIVDAAQTIRVWGEVIPEPNTAALLIIAMLYCTLFAPAFRRDGSYRSL
jgi:hypothetical protein